MAPAAHVQAMATGTTQTGSLAVRQIRAAEVQQLRTAANDGRQTINTLVTQLFANGMPTAQQKADFLASADGVINASALRVSSMAAVLPNGSTGLVPEIQQELLGTQSSSLTSRIQRVTEANRTSRSTRSLESAISREINTSVNRGIGAFNAYMRQNNLNQLSVDQSGQPIPLQQYLGTQAITQFGNTLGSLAQSFPTVANSILFPNGATTSTAANQQAFANQYQSALAVASSQLANSLSLFPGASTSLAPQLQSAFFGTGANSNSLLSGLQGLPTSSTGFNTAASTAFSNGFQGITTPLASYFGLPSTQSFSLPTGANIPSPFGSPFSDYGNGFNNGFGNGFPGFGQASTGFNTNFGTGFNNFINTMNTGFGFTLPTSTLGTTTLGTGILNPGTGTTTTGSGTTTSGTGTNSGGLGGLGGSGSGLI